MSESAATMRSFPARPERQRNHLVDAVPTNGPTVDTPTPISCPHCLPAQRGWQRLGYGGGKKV